MFLKHVILVGKISKKPPMESTHSKTGLFIVADDLGLAESVNDGIIFLLKESKINGASLMASSEAFQDAIDKIKTMDSPNIGIHFVLVEEKPLTSMVLPRNHKKFFIKYVLGLIKLADIEKELRNQLNKVTNIGIRPQFMNSHQHLHLLPGIMDICIKLAIEYDIPYIRIVNEPVNLSDGKLFRKTQLAFLNFLSSMAKKKIRKAGLQSNDFFVGFVNAGNLSEKDINKAKKLAEKYPDKVIELGCHLGYEDEELKRKYKHWGNYNWERELELLTNDK